MVTAENILEAINELIAAEYPENAVYVNLCSKDFSRPSFSIELGGEEREPVNRSTVEVKSYFTITCFGEVDERYNSDTEQLRAMQNTIMGLFKAGYISVGDRNLKVRDCTGGMDFDRCWVDLNFSYYDDRLDAADSAPLIKTVSIGIKEG